MKIQTYHADAFAEFLAELSKMPDGDGSMLDHGVLLYGSNIGNGNAHDEFPLPTMVVGGEGGGGGGGKIEGSQRLRYPDRAPLANLRLTLLQRTGLPTTEVGTAGRVLRVLSRMLTSSKTRSPQTRRPRRKTIDLFAFFAVFTLFIILASWFRPPRSSTPRRLATARMFRLMEKRVDVDAPT